MSTSPEEGGKNHRQQPSRRRPEPMNSVKYAWPARRADHRAIIAQDVGNAFRAVALLEETLQFRRGERGKIVHMLVAMRAEAQTLVACHRVPIRGARLNDSNRWRLWFHKEGERRARAVRRSAFTWDRAGGRTANLASRLHVGFARGRAHRRWFLFVCARGEDAHRGDGEDESGDMFHVCIGLVFQGKLQASGGVA